MSFRRSERQRGRAVLRWSYYLLFWYLPYRQLTRAQRSFIRRLHIAAFAAAAVTFVVHRDGFGAAVMVVAMILSASSLKLVDRDLEGGARVARTRWNLPADLELKPPASRQR